MRLTQGDTRNPNDLSGIVLWDPTTYCSRASQNNYAAVATFSRTIFG